MKNILTSVISKLELRGEELAKMQNITEELVEKIESKIKKSKIKAEVFVGGSSGKDTVVKREKQDIDVFVRFEKSKNKEKNKNISKQLEKILTSLNKKKIHGSRDYFKIKFKGLGFEIVPVLKISKPEQAENVTDLSYFHVSYVKKKIKQNPRLKQDIMLAKSFCFGNNVYGAESYIKGFSGYALELLIIYYKSFENLIRKMNKVKLSKEKKLVIDIEGHYKGKNIDDELNESKLSSPIIFIDPTYKERNALASLSYETFSKFQGACKRFLKRPSEKFFFKQKINAKQFNLILKARTSRQEGDIAGSKLWKFFKLMNRKLEKYFVIEKKEFDYEDKKEAMFYFKIQQKKQIIIEGPPVNAVGNVVKFKKKHKNCFIKKGKVYAKLKPLSIKKFLSDFKTKNKKTARDMGITGFVGH